MADFNQAIILGNLTRDPELRSTTSGQSVVSFSVATNRRWTNKDGQQQEDTEFHNVVAWGKLAEICAQILSKGRKVLVAGRLKTRSWEGQDGAKRFTTEIIADQVSAVGPARAGAGADLGNVQIPNEAPTAAPAKGKKAVTAPAEAVADEINLDDIPF
ncbi:single-stranded DNA-binding protein [Candidatus Berkelbacteria bacterium]|nr:single-stranded DNA-binding protein [Candidatus Berkelbacteria bacterium]